MDIPKVYSDISDVTAMPIKLTENMRIQWERWLKLTKERCHLNYEVIDNDLEKHISICLENSIEQMQKILESDYEPKTIVEIGCSNGFNCLALKLLRPDALIIGIEPDFEACVVANTTARENGLKRIYFLQSISEALPILASQIDLIVCNTVIEHVGDVNQTIAEIARTLNIEGRLNLEAPNYIWPVEPHLSIKILPLCPKGLMRLLARLQGKGHQAGYLEHLKLVYPCWLEGQFKKQGLKFQNLYYQKLLDLGSGKTESKFGYGRLTKILQTLNSFGLLHFFARLFIWLQIYPSVMYQATKPGGNDRAIS